MNYFRFSKIQEDPGDLLSWFNWFKGRGISCAIVKRGGEYALWRGGENAFETNRNGPISGHIIRLFDLHNIFPLDILSLEAIIEKGGDE